MYVSSLLAKNSKILLITDTAQRESLPSLRSKIPPLTSGVHNLATYIQRILESSYTLKTLNPYTTENNNSLFPLRFPLPRYPQFELAIPNPLKLWRTIKNFKPDGIIILTPDGSLGTIAKLLCHYPGSRATVTGHRIPYTLAFTTNIDEYLALYLKHHTQGLIRISPNAFYPYLKLAFTGAHKVLVPTVKIRDKLLQIGVKNTDILPRGVDIKLFRLPYSHERNPYRHYEWYKHNPKPIYLYHGRISLVKSIEDFLSLQTPQAHKVIIGEGPYKSVLEKAFSSSTIHFLGARYKEDLAAHVRFARLSFFPSKTDTWGQAINEASASGVPVVAYDTHGSGEIIKQGVTGVTVPLEGSLEKAIPDALRIDRNICSYYTKQNYSWDTTANIVLKSLAPINWK